MSSNSPEKETDSLAAIWDNDELIDYLAREAVQDALQEHKRKGEPISVWHDGKVVTLTADEIPERTPNSNRPVSASNFADQGN